MQRKRQKVLGPQDGGHATSHNTARGHVGAVTSRQRYVTSLMDSSEVRLPNPRKTKVLVSQARQDSQQQQSWRGDFARPSAHKQQSTYGILMM